MYKIIFQPLSIIDIQEIIDYYDLINPKITDDFLEELKISISNIEKMPKAFPTKLNNIRTIYLKKFRYGIYFKVYSEIKTVNIIAIIHTSRNPKIWKKR